MAQHPDPANAPTTPRRWIHLFEEDGAEGAVYVPEDGVIPLSRRPRERIELDPDGSATIFMPGPADRPLATAAHWEQVGDALIIRTVGGDRAFRVRQVSPSRWIVASAPA